MKKRVHDFAAGGLIARHTVIRLGMRIAPHDVRDAAATTWAIAAPDQVRVARDLLGRSNLRTTTRHYNRPRRGQAIRAYGQLILAGRRRQTSPVKLGDSK